MGRPEDFLALAADPKATYDDEVVIDLGSIEPLAAAPHMPDRMVRIKDLAGLRVDQAVIGSCTNGRIEDLREAAAVLKGRRAHKGVRLIILPATPKIWRQAMDEGLFSIFLDAGAVVGPPTCGPCLGGHMGILAGGERCISTTNRNFIGRMGSKKSAVILASPYTAAASALTGRVTDPREFLG